MSPRCADRPGLLGIAVPEQTWPVLVAAATFEQMRASADRLAPDPSGVLKDKAAFFRRGKQSRQNNLAF
jgi:aryl sulfotransferase